MDFKQEYQKIINSLIKENFPKLKNKEVNVLEIPKYVVWWVGGFVFKRFIIVTFAVRNLDKKSQRGLFANELCHVEDSIKRNYFQESMQFIRENLSWLFNTKFSFNIERKTELKTIRKGYGKELYEFSSKRERKKSKQVLESLYKRGYLSPKQIKFFIIIKTNKNILF